MNYPRNELVQYRLERAKEAFADGELLIENGSWNAAANRMYYACFYLVSAYLASRNLKATTHAGLKFTFNKEMVLSGKVSREDGKLFNELFGLRQEADYEDFISINEDDLLPMVPRIRNLISVVEGLIRNDTQDL